MRKLLLILASFVTLSVSAQEDKQEITKSPYITLLGKEYTIGDWAPFIQKLAKDTIFHVWELQSSEITAIYNNKNLRRKAYDYLWRWHLEYLYYTGLYYPDRRDEALIEWTKRNLKNIEDGYENSPLKESPKKACRKLMKKIKEEIARSEQ